MPATFNVLFLPASYRPERDDSLYYSRMPPPPSVDQILKAMAIYELHGFNDIALETALSFLPRSSVSASTWSAPSTSCAKPTFWLRSPGSVRLEGDQGPARLDVLARHRAAAGGCGTP